MEREWSPRDAQKRTIFAVHQKRKAGHPELVFGICESSISYLFLVGDKKEYGIIGNKKETNDEADSKTKKGWAYSTKDTPFAYWGAHTLSYEVVTTVSSCRESDACRMARDRQKGAWAISK